MRGRQQESNRFSTDYTEQGHGLHGGLYRFYVMIGGRCGIRFAYGASRVDSSTVTVQSAVLRMYFGGWGSRVAAGPMGTARTMTRDAALAGRRRESDLYAPVKCHLEALGYTVRGEVGRCDVVGVSGDSMVAVELKLAFGLPVLYQALQRLPSVDLVYVAVAVPEGRTARRNWDAQVPDAVRLCRMLGVGLLSVRDGNVVVHADPGPLPATQAAEAAGSPAQRVRPPFGGPQPGRHDEASAGDGVSGGRLGVRRRIGQRRDDEGGGRAGRDRCGEGERHPARRCLRLVHEGRPRDLSTSPRPGERALEQYADVLAARSVTGSAG